MQGIGAPKSFCKQPCGIFLRTQIVNSMFFAVGTICDFRLSYGRVLNRKSKIIAVNNLVARLDYIHVQKESTKRKAL